MFFHRVLCLLLIGMTISVPVFAEAPSKSVRMPEVLVTAKNQTSSAVVPNEETAEKTLNRVPGGAGVVRSEEVHKGRAVTPQDLLGWAPGVHVQQRDTASLESRISIRGSGLQRTFHLRGINLLQDGIPLNQADGGGDAQRIEPLAIDYTEVYRGGNALRYGATTLGGAINFVSPTGYSADLLQARFELGSFGYVRSQVSSGLVAGPWDYYVSASQFEQDGFRTHTAQDNYDIVSNIGLKINDSIESRLLVTFIEAKSKLGGGLTKSQLTTDPTLANASNVSGNYKRDFEFLRIASKTTITNDDRFLDLIGHWSSYDLFHPIFQVIYQDDDDWGGDLRYTDNGEIFGRRNELILGLGGSLGFVDDDRFTNSGGAAAGRTAEFENTALNLSLYGQDQFYLWERLALAAGAQLVYSERNVEDFFFGNGDDSGEVGYRSFNPKVGVLYDITDQAQIFVNYNKSFEPPSFSEMTTPAADFLPNKAQVANTVEAGTRGIRDRVGWDATYYYMWLDNELLSLNDPNGTALGTINAPSETIHQGVEIGANADVLRGILLSQEVRYDKVNLRALYNWNDFRFNGDPVYQDNQLPAMPEHFFKTEIRYEHPSGIYGGVNLEQTFEKYPIDMANTFFADPYSIWGVKIGYRAKKGPSLFFEGKNLGGEVYAASTGIVANANQNDSAQFNPGTGRSWFGGIEWKW